MILRLFLLINYPIFAGENFETMKCKVIFIFLMTIISAFKAQIGKDGNFSTTSNTVVNQYYSITNNINIGDNFVITSSPPSLTAGDLVLIIQMQGASVNCYTNPSNTLSSLPNTNYGAITNYNNAGNYEFAQVNSVSGNTVYLDCPLQKNYTASGKVQLIKVPRYNNLTVNNPHIIYGTPWNGNSGGVIAIEVSGTLNINSGGKISADTIGFRGGRTNLRNSSPVYGVGDFGHLDKNYGVYKGESIAGDTTLYASLFSGKFGKGAVANGGGGGNAVNAGGGGGANAGDTSLWNGKGNPDVSNPSWITAWNLESSGFASNVSSGGGRGGYTYSNSNKDPLVYGPNDYTNWGGDGRSNNGGLGGRPLDYASGRVFLGGGGGAGDSDNNYAGRGGSGGGIIFILNYGQIIANGIITANGRDGYNTSTPTPNVNDLTGRDGAGGGGGGGAVIIKTPNPIVGTLTVTAKGGNGGNQQMKSGYIFGSPNDAYGPGGGGGGGYIGSNVSIPNTNVAGGNNGIVQYLSGPNGCQIDNNFPPNGATKGGNGIVTNTLSAPESISVTPSSATICAGSSLTATAVANTTLPVNWYSNYTGTTTIGTGTSITISYTTAGTYTIFAGTCPGIVRVPVVINVMNNPTVSVNSATICSGQSATLIASGASTYTWNSGANTNSIVVNPSTNTNYTVMGANGNCVDTKTTQVIVNPSPTIGVNSSTICNGQSATLIANGASSYTWNTGANTNSITVNPISTTIYTVSGSNGICVSSETTQVLVNTTPTITVNSATICTGQSATLIANGATTYTWDNGANTNSISINPTTNTNYTVIGANGNCIDTQTTQVIVNPSPTLSVNSSTICSGQSATLIVNGAISYTWNTGANSNSISVNPSSTIIYTVQGSNGNCVSTETTQVIVNSTPTISVNSPSICSGLSATLIANGASSYTWNTGINSNTIIVNPSATTNYTVVGSNGNCTSTQTTQVIVNNPPVITVNSTTICNGQSAVLNANGATSYTWNTGAQSSSIVVSPSSTTSYTVSGSLNGCISSQTTNVVVLSTPALTITPSASFACKNSCVSFTYSPTTYTNVMFDFGNGYTYLYSNCYPSVGIYTAIATGTNNNGCTYTSSPISINVVDNPVASFNMSSQGFAGESVTINNTSTGAQLYNWSFGDGNTLTTYSFNITHTFLSAGKFCVFLTAIDTAFLCSDTVTKCIDIQDNFEIEIPNVFTPNNDGTNDIFKVRAKGIKNFYGEIYDRWGIKLFEWSDVNAGWNGYLKNNAKAPTGTYYYIIKCTLINDEQKEFKGYITLLE